MSMIQTPIPRDDNAKRILYSWNWLTVLTLVYLAWLITTPHLSNRLAFLADIRFEKWLAAACFLGAVASGKMSNWLRVEPVLMVAFACWLYVCSFVSPWAESTAASEWRGDYWKDIFLFAFVLVSIKSIQDFRFATRGIVLIIVFYQAYSFFDFVRGGSFVYQQGMKRMVGAWSGGGIGAANGWAYLGVWALPLIVELTKITGKRGDRYLVAFAFSLSVASIVFSGTRAAFIVACLYLAIRFRKIVVRPLILLLVGAGLVSTIALLPEKVQSRYTSQLTQIIWPDPNTKEEQRAITSARSRLDGLVDGFKIAADSPIFGCGPGVSAIARSDYRPSTDETASAGLHSLFGQVVAEAGFVGSALWAIMVGVSIVNLRRVDISSFDTSGDQTTILGIRNMLLGVFFVMLVYGLAAHSLYGYKWMTLFALATGFTAIANSMNRESHSV